MFKIFGMNFDGPDNFQNFQFDPTKILIGDPWYIQ